MSRHLVLTCVALAALTVPAAAQESVPLERVIRGLVVDSVSGRPLGGVVFYFDGRKDEFFTGSDGQFRITGVRLRDSVLVVRRIGYVPLRVPVPGQETAVAIDMGQIPLKPVATNLDRIAVETEEVIRYPLLADFYRRKQNNSGGFFVTRQDIERSSAHKVSDVLRRTPKIAMDCPNDRVGADDCIARNRRGRVIRPLSPQAGRRAGGAAGQFAEDTTSMEMGVDRCEMEIYVDGRRSGLKIDDVPLSWVAGMEVYSGLATTPPGLGSGRCGVVAIWTTGTIGN